MKKTNWRQIKKQQQNSSKQEKSSQTIKVYYAGFWSRILAFVIDIFMIGLPITFIIMALFGYDQMQSLSTMDLLEGIKPVDANGVEIKPDPTVAIVHVVLFATIMITLWRYDGGRTPGKRLSKTKIVDSKSLDAPAFWQLFVRFFAYFLSFVSFIFIIGFLLPLLHPKKRFLHDLLSRTVVIYDLD